ncbi:hypothetical protein [Xanthobacter autotrophicus]|jgi:hypothetical protein|uniref:hypothetical protein n=1 Tax=Xanthobacter autotrophicus TaxID=280 RepID=UPI00372C89F3
MKNFLIAVCLCIVMNGANAEIALAAGNQSNAPAPADLRAQAASHLKFLYGMYFAIRACTEAHQEQSELGFKPTVSLSEAQSVLRAADASARSVGVDVDRAWLEMSSIGQAAGEALKLKSDDNFKKCQQSGMFFRTITSRLQMTIDKLDGIIPLIKKDF